MREPRYGYAVDVLKDKARYCVTERALGLEHGNTAYASLCLGRLEDLNGAIQELGGKPIPVEAQNGRD